ncbi:serine/threonine-protein phosphatase 7 long form homolog [Tasmannia lanceolata]|uniref:serine/threonine-protein phosphatase 7 long form homolog n=1 Tax=Tasmannia lanceolata TaxID=3420 RepID=UPI0040647F0B
MASGMAEVSNNGLLAWINGLHQVEGVNLGTVGLCTLRNIATICVDWGLLRAAISCWDPDSHVFHFGMQELCPTHEDICMMLCISPDGPIFKPSFKEGYDKALSRLIGVPQKSLRHYRQASSIFVHKLVQVFSPSRELDMEYRRCRENALALCAYLMFLFPGRSESSDLIPLYFVDLVDQVRQGANLAPTVLAELFDSLDSARRSTGSDFLGSSVILYVWLVERLRILAPPPLPRRAWTRSFNTREVFVSFDDHDSWAIWLKGRESKDIEWTLPWAPISSAVLETSGQKCVQIMGFQNSSFYLPLRILRQYFGAQHHIAMMNVSVPDSIRPQSLKKMTVNAIDRDWNRRTIVVVQNNPTPGEVNNYFWEWYGTGEASDAPESSAASMSGAFELVD